MMSLDKRSGQCEALRRLVATVFARLPLEIPNVEEDNDQVIECAKGFLFYRKRSIAVGLISALHLNSYSVRGMPRVRVNADQVIALVIRLSFIRQDITAHESADCQVFRTQRNNR